MKEQRRTGVVILYEAGQLTGEEVAEVLGVSLRQARRIIACYRKEGIAGIAHGNRGKPSPRATEPELRKEIVFLA